MVVVTLVPISESVTTSWTCTTSAIHSNSNSTVLMELVIIAATPGSYPLRGGKASNWQGGIRVNSWVSGGALPAAMRGKKLEGLTCVWDIYATFAHLAGADPTDHSAAAAGLPPIDSVNLWPYLSGQSMTSPRTIVPIGSTTCEGGFKEGCINNWGWGDVKTIVQGMIQDRGTKGLWKLMVGANPMNGWQGPRYPNATSRSQVGAISSSHTATMLSRALILKRCTLSCQHAFSFQWVHDCGEKGCLFRLDRDPTEHVDLISANASVAEELLQLIEAHNKTTFSPYRGPGEQNKDVAAACTAAVDRYGGFFGPFVNVTTDIV